MVDPATLFNLINRYPILNSLASELSTLDLSHLGLVCKAYHNFILASPSIWAKLSSQSRCDGNGLRHRQDLTGPYELSPYAYGYRKNERELLQDEEIEVRLYNRRCHDDDTLPCCKCGINVCEECRYYPRVPKYPCAERRPHLNSIHSQQNIICLCDECDEAAEEEVKGKFLNELCDCDIFTRWICVRCHIEEKESWRLYTSTCCKGANAIEDEQYPEGYDDDDDVSIEYPDTKEMEDHSSYLFVSLLLLIYFIDFLYADGYSQLWCTCKAKVPQYTVPRCIWCRRRHLNENEWHREWRRIGLPEAMFENVSHSVR